MTTLPPTIRVLVAILLCSACGQDYQPSNMADARVAEATCPESATGGADVLPVRVGSLGDEGFVDMAEGEEVELVWGRQGFVMLAFKVAVELDMPGEETVCFQCQTSMSSPIAAFPEVTMSQMFPFTRLSSDLYSTGSLFLILGEPANYDGESARVAVSCDGHERSGAVERMITLFVPPPPA